MAQGKSSRVDLTSVPIGDVAGGGQNFGPKDLA